MTRHPSYPLSIALAAWCHAQRCVYQFAKAPAVDQARALELASRAIAIGGDATTLAVLGHALAGVHDLERAGIVTAQALSLDGASAWAWMRSGWLDVYRGHHESAIERFAISLELAPNDPLVFNNFVGLASAHFHARRYVEAMRWDERALAAQPSAIWVHRRLCSTYVLAGNKSEGRRSLAAFRGGYPEATASQCARAAPSPAVDQDLMAGVLESMGLPP
jgi:tetratricopeptide (TPR) repeat protein